MPNFPKAIDRPYTAALAFVAADALSRRTSGRALPVKRALRWQYRRIAALDAPYGRRLDDLGASLRQVRWVASPGTTGTERGGARAGRNLDVEARFQALVALLEGRSPFKTFKVLVASFPTIDPRTGDEIAPVNLQE